MNEQNELVFTKISTLLDNQNNWFGTMTSLKSSLNRISSKQQRLLMPGSPGALRMVINRIANRLRSRGVSIKFGRTSDHARTRYVKFTH